MTPLVGAWRKDAEALTVGLTPGKGRGRVLGPIAFLKTLDLDED